MFVDRRRRLGTGFALLGLLAAAIGAGACSSSSAPSSGGASSTRAPSASSTGPSSTVSVPGLSASSVTIGVTVTANSQAASSALGITGQGFVVEENVVKRIVASVNASGGLAGHHVELVFNRADASKPTTPQEAGQAACTTFTQDNHVYAAVGIFEPTPEELQCLGAAHVPDIVSSGVFAFNDTQVFTQNPLFVNVSAAALERAARAEVAALRQGGFFDQGKLGVVRLSSAAFDRAYTSALQPALQSAGATVTETAAIKEIESTDDVARAANEAANAVLRMKGAGVTNVLFFESGGALPFYFSTAAKNQHYAFRVGETSMGGGQGLADQIQLGDALMAGWVPGSDVRPADAPANDAATHCLSLVDPGGKALTTPNMRLEVLRFCDVFDLLGAALRDTGSNPDGAALLHAVEGLGTQYVSPVTGATHFGAQQHDGPAQYRLARHDATCRCWKYEGEPQAIP
jgi:hypothetical protein